MVFNGKNNIRNILNKKSNKKTTYPIYFKYMIGCFFGGKKMEGVVAKRCLRQSSYEKFNRYNYKTNNGKKINSLYKKTRMHSNGINENINLKREGIKHRIKMKLWIQSINAMCILIIVVSSNMMNISKINNNKCIKIISNEYKKNYSLGMLKEKGIKTGKKTLLVVSSIVPDKIEKKLVEYHNNIKKNLTNIKKNNKKNDNPINNKVNIYLEENNKHEDKSTNMGSEEGVGVSIEENVKNESQEMPTLASSQSVSESAGIVFIKPAEGKVSSEYGEREVIFTDVDPYHTGIDIANEIGTIVRASTDGTVTKVAYNKYNGNFIEITIDNIVTKYAHLDSVNVNKGSKVKAGDQIGKMGDTGYATGPHLHFEIVEDGKKINPREKIDI